MWSELAGKFQRKTVAAISAVGTATLTGVCCFVAGTPCGKKVRLQFKCGSAPDKVKLNNSPYVGQHELESDLEFEIKDGVKRQGGVRIVWSVCGAGKTTTIKHVLDKLIQEKEISGVVYVTPSADKDASAAEWLECATTDIFGPIITRKDKISDILGSNGDKPFVIVLDQVEGTAARAKGFEELVRALAYDSDACKAYISLVVTSDIHLAEEVFLWNEGTKISFLGSHTPWTYKWTKKEAEMWINKLLEMDENKKLRSLLGLETPLRRNLIDKATTAGTPACLVTGVQLLEKDRTLHHSLDTYASTCKFGWELGEKTLSELRKHEGPK